MSTPPTVTMSTSISKNPELDLAELFVTQTDLNVFLTGKAGTGKTTFLKSLSKITAKRFVVTAPTGVAAINAGGVTLHSFFQLPLGPYLPNRQAEDGENRRYFRLSSIKKEIIINLELLVIDEISMVRADLLDSVDAVLRRVRRSQLPFGGVQLLMIGDLYQLPPIVKNDEWQLLRQTYDTAFFFSSQCLRETGFVGIELDRVYRQSDNRFIHILNQIRYNQLDPTSIADLNQRYCPQFKGEEAEGYITLTTHNRKADSINYSYLSALSEKERTFTARINGDFPENVTPAQESLTLKKGSQVMFLRNDNSSEKAYYNGKIGKVTKVTPDSVEVICTGETSTVSVSPVKWENVKYSMNQETSQIESEIVGTFEQYPLKLAWAITIHKSQGLTFEKAIIDSEAAFSPGQTYVALSRCETLSGIILKSPIPEKGIAVDPAVAGFYTAMKNQPSLTELLDRARRAFQHKLLRSCFDFEPIQFHLKQLIRVLKVHARSITLSGKSDPKETLDTASRDLFDISQKFSRQLENLFHNQTLPESDPVINERLTKASSWFQGKLDEILGTEFCELQLKTENSLVRQKIGKIWDPLMKEIRVKRAAMKALEKGFDSRHYLQQISVAETSPKSLPKKSNDKDGADTKSIETQSHPRKGDKKQKVAHPTPPQYNPLTVTKTKQASFDLLKRGLTIEEIAKKRGLKASTIQGHLCGFIEMGLLDVNQFVSSDKQEKIRTRLALEENNSLSAVKESLGDDFSYEEIRMVAASSSQNND